MQADSLEKYLSLSSQKKLGASYQLTQNSMQSPIIVLGGNILVALVVLSQVLILFFAFIYFKERKNPLSKEFAFLKKHSLFVAFIVALMGFFSANPRRKPPSDW